MTLDGVFGMREMENAVAKIIENGIDNPFSYTLFGNDNHMMVGFTELLIRGWLDRAMYNGHFAASARLKSRLSMAGRDDQP
jgi:hypothetical protein